MWSSNGLGRNVYEQHVISLSFSEEVIEVACYWPFSEILYTSPLRNLMSKDSAKCKQDCE